MVRKVLDGSLGKDGRSLSLVAVDAPRAVYKNTPRNKEALDILAYYHANGNHDDRLVQFEYEEICTAIEEEKFQAKTGWLDLFRSPRNRRRMRIAVAIAVFSQWSGSGLV